jgi:hypothetical protein
MELFDSEKNRAEYVVQLERSSLHLQQELAKYRAIVEKWQPVLKTEILQNEVKFTLSLNNKYSSAVIAMPVLQNTDITTLTSAIVDALVESNVAARLREIVEPEINRILPSLATISSAGKW